MRATHCRGSSDVPSSTTMDDGACQHGGHGSLSQHERCCLYKPRIVIPAALATVAADVVVVSQRPNRCMRCNVEVSVRIRMPVVAQDTHRHRCFPATVRPNLIVAPPHRAQRFFIHIRHYASLIEVGANQKTRMVSGFFDCLRSKKTTRKFH